MSIIDNAKWKMLPLVGFPMPFQMMYSTFNPCLYWITKPRFAIKKVRIDYEEWYLVILTFMNFSFSYFHFTISIWDVSRYIRELFDNHSKSWCSISLIWKVLQDSAKLKQSRLACMGNQKCVFWTTLKPRYKLKQN